MTDYISRKDVLRYIAEDCRKTRAHLGLYRDNKAVQIDICRIPAADVAPVVHGRWIKKEFLHCSECDMPTMYPWPYCQKCGAKMDGGVTDA